MLSAVPESEGGQLLEATGYCLKCEIYCAGQHTREKLGDPEGRRRAAIAIMPGLFVCALCVTYLWSLSEQVYGVKQATVGLHRFLCVFFL